MSVTVVGIDCAVDEKEIGLALGHFDGQRLTVHAVERGCPLRKPARQIVDWLDQRPSERVLFALDAPLGWPTALGSTLVRHQAGNVITHEPNNLFRRATDRFVKCKIGKQSLDVGADRIARATHAALKLIEELRSRISRDIPLAWCSTIDEPMAIEVYPSATLIAHGIDTKGYKAKGEDGVSRRKEVLFDIKNKELLAGVAVPDISKRSDELDAMICLVAAKDFLLNNAFQPHNIEIAKKEGWIWVNQTVGACKCSGGQGKDSTRECCFAADLHTTDS